MVSLSSLVINVLHHRKAIGRAIWLADNRDGDDDDYANILIPLHIHQASNSDLNIPIPLIDTNATIAPNSDGSSLKALVADDPITFTTEIAPDAPDDSVATSTFREANVTRRHTTLP